MTDVRTMSTFFALLTVLANLAVLSAIGLWLAAKVSSRGRARGDDLRSWVMPAALPLAWTVALVAMAGSLYYSEVVGYVPCTLCWYQRIAMYPMALLLGIATLRRDRAIGRYLIPLALVGGAISIYHYQLQRFPTQASFSCTESAPCALTYVWQFHYISIPLMALSAFALIATLLVIARRSEEGADARAIQQTARPAEVVR